MINRGLPHNKSRQRGTTMSVCSLHLAANGSGKTAQGTMMQNFEMILGKG